ncbi:kinase-regulated stress-responsive transcription factor skn7 [Rhodotorula kratochvilovae]
MQPYGHPDPYAQHHHGHPHPHAAPQHPYGAPLQHQQLPHPHPQQQLDDGPGTRKRKAAQMQSQGLGDDDDDEKPGSDAASAGGSAGQGVQATGGKAKGGASEFVKKLYKMLDEGEYQDIVSWGIDGTSFVVKDMNQFTTAILPLHFKHSNFASFVRQLNKYDFHKVKNTDEGANPYGDNTWEFRHPNFGANMKDSLENIKRKAPAAKKAQQAAQAARGRHPPSAGGNGAAIDPALAGPSGAVHGAHGGAHGAPGGGGGDAGLQAQLNELARTQVAMQQHMTNLSQDYQAVIGEMMNFQRNMVAQDQLMQNLIQYLVSLEADSKGATQQDPSAPYVPSSQAQKLISSYTEVARASYDQMADLTRRASLSGGAFPNLPPLPPPPPSFGQFDFGPPQPAQSSSSSGARRDGPEGRQQNGQGAYGEPRPGSVPQQQPGGQGGGRDGPGQGSAPPPATQFVHPAYSGDGPGGGYAPGPPAGPSAPAPPPQQQPPQQQQQGAPGERPGSGARRQSNVPGWAVPPRVLLVEDDAVCRKLSSKFLEVFGCQIDVAVDGVSAVNKMNVQKYDLVLMDIVMPNLDGVSATSLIRQFDPNTPIISMTSNSGPNDIMTYFSHGMNDVLPKPFTKENLLSMLEKHLVHLKLMQQMAEIPRALGFTDNQIQDALAQSVVIPGEGPDGGQQVLNPFSSMGISDQDYVEMLQGIAMEKEGKRGLEVVRGEGTARFQEVQ